jgi:hypothetical protein
MKYVLSAALGLALSGLVATSSSASTVTLEYLGIADGARVSAQIDGVEVEPRGPFLAGSFDIRDHFTADTFLAWCVEVTQLIADKATYTVTNSFLDPQRDTFLSQLFTGFLGQTGTDVGAAAFQLAIWEIVEETATSNPGDLSLTTGIFTAASSTAEVISTANSWLAALGQYDPSYRITYFVSPTSQDIITVAPVPLPAGILLLGAGVGALVLVRRRAQSKTATA